ncbi:MAG: TonB-dependent receptor, partial [Betaproteobacteria bacterium]
VMYKHRLLAFAVALSVLPHAGYAATDDDLRELREQVRQLKERYEKRIEALEKRLQQTEQATGKADAAAAQAQAAASQAQSSGRPAGESAFNPGISLILNGTWGNLSRDPARYRIDGFAPTGGEVAPPGRGLNLGESEIVMSANVDQHFRGTLIAALGAEGRIGVEEGYLETIGLSNGFSLKGGRFFSSVGYLNEIHAHAWDFADAPLVNKAFLGNRLADDGVHLKWVAPTDLYFALGAEAGRGRKFPGGPDGGRSKNGAGSGTLFAHLGGDIGASTAWRVGLSRLQTSPQDRTYTDLDSTGTSVTNSFTGRSRLWVFDGVLKWAPNGNATQTSFKLQGEYFRRSEEGDLTYDSTAASRGTQTGRYASQQSGYYVQGVYQFRPQWRAGYRYDRLDSGTASLGLVSTGARSAADFPILSRYNPIRNTFMVDWSPSEFSRVRLQFARDRSQFAATDNQVFLQYIMSLGAHGAHKF